MDAVLWKLTGGDIAKAPVIENLEVGFCYDWYYNLQVKELNEMLYNIEVVERLKG